MKNIVYSIRIINLTQIKMQHTITDMNWERFNYKAKGD